MLPSLKKKQTEYTSRDRLLNYQRRYARAQSIAQQWWSILEACYHYCIPNRNLFYRTNQNQGEQRNIKVFDTTQVAAARTYTSKLQSALCPPQKVWCDLEAGAFIGPEFREDANRQLKTITEAMFAYVHNSNYDVSVYESFQDIITGTAALTIQDGPSDYSPLVFGSIPLAQLAIEESISGKAESGYRTWGDVKISDIQIMWPNAVLTQEMKSDLRQNPAATVKNLIEAVVHNQDRGTYSYCLWVGMDFLLEEESVSPSMIIFRTSKINNEVFGRGVAIDALPSIISLQTIAYYELTAANLNICKPYMAYSDGVFNPWTFVLAPNTVIPVNPTTNGQFPIQPLPDVSNPAFMQLVSGDLRQQINKLMYADPLPPLDQKGQPKTATEISIRQNNLAEELGPAFTRLQQEFMQPVINRIIFLLQRRGLIPKLVVDGQEIKIRYKSPLTISQGQQDVQTLLNYVQSLQFIVGPEQAPMYINPINTPIWMAEKLGVDMNLVNSKEEMQEIFKQMNEQKQNMLEMQQQQEQQHAA